VRTAGLLMDPRRPRAPSILIGRYRGRFLALPGQLSVMLSAPTRSGKGVGVVVPNLLNWPDSAVVLDIKGENYAITAGYRAECGQAVYAFSPFDQTARSHRWNPLTAVRTDRLHRVGDLIAIGQVLFPNDGTSTSSEAFFNDQARNVFLGLGLLLLETPDLPRTIGEMLRQSSGKGRALKDHLSSTIADRAEQRRPLSEECVDALQRLLSTSENTLSSIVSTFNAPLTIFADAVVDAATSADDFSLADVRRRRMSVYVRIPPNRLASARPLLNLFFSQLINLNTQRLRASDEKQPMQCLLVHDEFTSMGRVGVISSAAAFLAGYNLRLLTVVQAMSQLDSVYGDREARTFATNHGLQILFAPREQRDAEEYSAMLGHFTARATSRGRSRSFSTHGHTTVTRNESDQRRSLLLPQEFKELGSERLVVIAENCKPILAEKIRYHRDKAFTARLRRAPAVPAMDMDLHFAKAQQRWRYAPEDLPADETLRVEALAHDLTDLPELGPAATATDENEFVCRFFEQTRVRENTDGRIEPLAVDQGNLEPAINALEEAHV
jgi:type IV secretion system protein VirD4